MNRIRALRENMGWTQTELGEKLEVQTAAISKYEKGDVSLTDETLRQLAIIFNTSTDFILCISDDPLPDRDVDQDLHDELDMESKWLNFLKNLSGDSMFYEYESTTEEDKLAIIKSYEKQQQKKQQKVDRFKDFPADIIDDAYIFAKFAAEKRKLSDE